MNFTWFKENVLQCPLLQHFPFSTYPFSCYILWIYNPAIQCILPLVNMSSPNRMETQGTDYAVCTAACSIFVYSLSLIRRFLTCVLDKVVLLKASSVPDMTVPYLKDSTIEGVIWEWWLSKESSFSWKKELSRKNLELNVLNSNKTNIWDKWLEKQNFESNVTFYFSRNSLFYCIFQIFVEANLRCKRCLLYHI